jgi:hypothetical protein
MKLTSNTGNFILFLKYTDEMSVAETKEYSIKYFSNNIGVNKKQDKIIKTESNL